MKSNLTTFLKGQKLVFIFLGPDLDYTESFNVASANELLHDQMKQTMVNFKYLKQNGEIREAVGTLNPILIERVQQFKGVLKNQKKTQAYFDIEKNEWRSFRVENLIDIF